MVKIIIKVSERVHQGSSVTLLLFIDRLNIPYVELAMKVSVSKLVFYNHHSKYLEVAEHDAFERIKFIVTKSLFEKSAKLTIQYIIVQHCVLFYFRLCLFHKTSLQLNCLWLHRKPKNLLQFIFNPSWNILIYW